VTLVQLEAFVMAARLGTFSAAAAQLGITQPAISELTARLEAEFNTKLFHRKSKKLLLTSAGEQLLPFAEQCAASAAQGLQAVRSMMSLGGGTATFGLLRNADYYLSTDLATRFHRQYPDVRVRLIGQNSAETAADVAAGNLEAGLVTLPINDEDLDVVPLARDDILYVTADPQRASKPPTIQDFCSAPLVLYDAHYPTADPARRQIAARAQLAGLRLEPIIEVEYLSTALSLVAGGIGDTIACRAAIASPGFPDGLHCVEFAEPLYEVLALIKRRRQILSPATRELAQLAHESLMQHQRSALGTTTILPTSANTDSFFF
jgi:DNA-binding transcriptional LysR family regulator